MQFPHAGVALGDLVPVRATLCEPGIGTGRFRMDTVKSTPGQLWMCRWLATVCFRQPGYLLIDIRVSTMRPSRTTTNICHFSRCCRASAVEAGLPVFDRPCTGHIVCDCKSHGVHCWSRTVDSDFAAFVTNCIDPIIYGNRYSNRVVALGIYPC